MTTPTASSERFPLLSLLPKGEEKPSPDLLLERFLDYVTLRGLALYPAQENAILELFEGNNVILNTPTGSGKSLVATAVHFYSLALGKRSVYTCPIKALVNEKWLALCREFGPENVGLSTGDASVNRDAPILCCTAEVLANIALREGGKAAVDDVIMDEFHYYSDRSRGVAWQVPLLTLPQSRFLLMSATLGETAFFEKEMTTLTGRPSATISSMERPVPLEFSYSETPMAQTLENLLGEGKAPIYVVHFTQLEAAQSAQAFTSIPVATREEKALIAKAMEGVRFNSPYGPEIRKWLRHGIGIHHAGLLPKYRILVEQLAQQGLLKVICGTDTLGVGINVPIRCVLFTRLCKFGGDKTAILSSRDFHQIAGRAGRKGYDNVGWVVAQAPEHVIENRLLEEKKKGKFVKRKPPERNFVLWDQQTFARLMSAPPERLTSRFEVSHGLLLNVLSRRGDARANLRDLIARSHESARAKKEHRKRAWQLFRALRERGIVEIIPKEADGTNVRLNVELQDDFSMNQTLSLFLHDTLPLLDAEGPEYPFVVLTLVESILENPEVILRKQLDRIKGEAIAEMKADGLDYDARMEELEKLEYPKPHRDFIYNTFNAFSAKHPWVGQENIKPKSIAREMFEEYRSFADTIKVYELQRAEGILLRYLSNVHKVLVQTVPENAKNDLLREMELYLGTMIRQVDSSLLEEWEKLRDPNYQPKEDEAELRPPGAEEAARDVTRDKKTFLAAIRHRLFAFLRAARQGEAALPILAGVTGEEESPLPPSDWTEARVREAFDAYREGHGGFRLDPEARNLRHTYVTTEEGSPLWRVQQMLIDHEELNDWAVEVEVDLNASREKGEPVVTLTRIGPIG